MSEEEIINKVREIVSHKDDYDEGFGTKVYRPYMLSREDHEAIEKLLYIIEGKDCVIETQAHNEEVLMDYFNRHSCLRCEDGKPAYCEKCFQELIGMNAKMQQELNEKALECSELEKERDGIYEDYQDLGKDFYKTSEELNQENLRCAEFAIENYILKDKLRYEDLHRCRTRNM